MNGAPLPRDHGYPVRALAPGHAGARSCKVRIASVVLMCFVVVFATFVVL